MDKKDVIALGVGAAAVTDILLIPLLRAQIKGPKAQIVTLVLLSGSVILLGLASAFHFGWIPVN